MAPDMAERSMSRRESTLDSLDEKQRAKLERRFLRKLDICLITWAWFAYLIKVCCVHSARRPPALTEADRLVKLQDSLCIRHARRREFAGGCRSRIPAHQQLNFQGNQLNFLDTYYRIGYAIFLIPSQVILTKIRPNLWLPPLELAWGIMTGESPFACSLLPPAQADE